MRAIVTLLNTQFSAARATTTNELGIAFRLPTEGSVSLSDELDVDLQLLDVEQRVHNVTTGETLHLVIASQDVVDLRLPEARWPARFPSLERRLGR